MAKVYLGIDLGGTEVKMAVVDEYGKILQQNSFSHTHPPKPAQVVKEIVNQYNELKGTWKFSGTGIGVAGDIDQEKGIVRFSPNLEWKNVYLGKMLSAHLPKPIMIDNDANAAAWGAYWLEAKGNVRNLICITLGTGVGGGLIFDGKLYRGATGSAGEIGHMSFDPFGPKCKCGNKGCIECYVGGPHLSNMGRKVMSDGKGRVISKLAHGNLKEVNPRLLAIAAGEGDATAKQIWKDAGEKLGIVLASVIDLLNPEMIVIAGGVSKAGNLLLNPIKDTVKDRAFKTPAKACKIVISKYTQKLGVVGAALLVK